MGGHCSLSSGTFEGPQDTGVVALPCPEFSLSSLLHPAAGVLVSLWGSYPCPSPLCLSCLVSFSVSHCLSLFWFLLFCPVTSLGAWWTLAGPG